MLIMHACFCSKRTSFISPSHSHTKHTHSHFKMNSNILILCNLLDLY